MPVLGSSSSSSNDLASLAFLEALNGVQTFAFGDSWSVGGTSSGAGYNTLLTKITYNNGTVNYGQAGTNVADVARKVLVSWGGTNRGFITITEGVNDTYLGQSATWPGGSQSAQEAYNVMLAALLGAAPIQESSGSCAYTGTWTSTADTNASGGNVKSTATQNDYVDITFTGDAVTLILQNQGPAAVASGPVSGTGADFTVTNVSGGAVLVTGTTSLGTMGSNTNVPKGVRISGLGAGSHTVRLKKTDASAGTLIFDCAITPRVYPPTVVIVKQPLIPARNQAWFDAYGSVLSGAITTANAGSAVLLVDLQALGFDMPTMMYNYVGTNDLHYNDVGSNFITREILKAVRAVGYRQGLNVLVSNLST